MIAKGEKPSNEALREGLSGSESSASFDPFLDATGPLTPANAVACILMVGDGSYLMQLRDRKPEIFFPGHWSCFGGAIDHGETEEQAVRRELREELGLILHEREAMFFSRMSFDFEFAGHGVVGRTFFQISLDHARAADLRLNEGAQMKAFDARSLLSLPNVAPYDRFALWMHASRARLSAHLPAVRANGRGTE